MTRARVGMFAAVLVTTCLVAPTVAHAQTPEELPVVGIAITDADWHDRVQDHHCIQNYDSPVASYAEFTVSRTGPLDDPLVVDLTLRGAALDPAFATLPPESVAIAADADSATFTVEVLDPIGPRTVSHSLVVEVAPSAAYEVGEDSSASVLLATDRDPSIPPEPCDWGAFDQGFAVTVGTSFDGPFGSPSIGGYRWYLGPDSGISLRIPVNHAIRQVGGTLPPGVEIDAVGDVHGAPTVAGSFTSEWEVCLPEDVRGDYAAPFCTTFSVTFDVAALPVVTVQVEPTGPSVRPECDDVIVFRDVAFTFTRTGATTDDLTVAYAVGGDAVAGEDYVALPGTVVIPAGEDSVTVVPEMLFGDRTEIVQLMLTVVGSDDYDVGAPSSAVGFPASPRDPALGEYECMQPPDDVDAGGDVDAEDDDGARAGVLPRTGARSLPGLALVGLVVLLAGAVLTGAGRRRAA